MLFMSLNDGHGCRETPGPIPNPVVKPARVSCAYLDARAPGKHVSLSFNSQFIVLIKFANCLG